MTNPSRLLKDQVAPDIWREISELLDPIDVVALGVEYDFFLPSYPIDEMSVTQLRRAALGPHLWTQRVYKHAVSPNVPFYDLGTGTVLPPVSTIPFDGQLNSDRFRHLVPGGRFLITCDAEHSDRDHRASRDTDIFTLKLWDLGFAGRKPLFQPLLLASRDIGPRLANQIINMDCSIRGTETLAVALSTIANISHRRCLFRVFVISPHRPNPSFDQLSSMSADFSRHWAIYPSAFHLRGDKVLAQFEDDLVVWDFIVSLYVIVPLHLEGRAVSRKNQFLLSGDLVILVTVLGAHQYLLSQWTALPETQVPHLEIPTRTPTSLDSQSRHLTLPAHSVDGDHNVVHISPSSVSLPLTWDIIGISQWQTSPAGRVQSERFSLSVQDEHSSTSDMISLSIDHVGTYKVPSGEWAPPISSRVVAWNSKAPLTLLKMLPDRWERPQRHPSQQHSGFGPQPTDTHIMGCAALGYGGVVASCTGTGRFIVNMEYEIDGQRLSLVDYMA
ncbi:hypothetical protein DFP72DRAFT_871580 [Ephemerocybe angulata]|uniref:Uncharacterized protein n=1 Tax=Ephemerocybe angulata TaxID=980116 RepID=A0A8H6IH40_9AGAR|nr:hypothetical protein DFP72DRAFT_871580 [Tulosesus angulatus]